MKNMINKTTKKEHAPGCTCSICGQNYKGISFKSGYICESCLNYIKDIAKTNDNSDKSGI
jgi:hypothetical protein